MEHISIETARKLILMAQGLDRPPSKPATKTDVLAAIRQMGYLQIDTIHVIARSPYLVLWSRLGEYRPEWLDELLAERAIFEFWAHAMCFLPIENYPYYRRSMLEAGQKGGWPFDWAVEWMQANAEINERVRSHLREKGEVRSVEFTERSRPASGWWDWKDEKNALEAMLMTGEVMIARRQNFQRVYALRERILPDWDDADTPSSEELKRMLTLRSVRSLGVATPAWVSDYFRQPKTGMDKQLSALAEEGQLLRVGIESLKDPAYIHPENAQLLEQVETGGLQPEMTTLLSPFDPLVADRRRGRELFGFDYLIECYTPAAKRRYGYFSLPILHRGRLVGRLDPKAHRAQRIFEVKALHLEPGVEPDAQLIEGLAGALQRLATWHGTPEVVVRWSDPPEAAEALKTAL